MKKYFFDGVYDGVIYAKCVNVTPEDSGEGFGSGPRLVGVTEVFDTPQELRAAYVQRQERRIEALQNEISAIRLKVATLGLVVVE